MRLIHHFFILAILVTALCALLLSVTFSDNKELFYISEGIFAVILIYLIIFYQKTVKPIDKLTSGMELLREQDMSTRLAPSGQKETDEIVKTFNAILGQLRNEHLRLDEQNTFLNLLIEASPMGVIICDINGKVKSMNPAANQMMTPVLEKSLNELPLGKDETVRLSNSQIYHISHLSFLDRGYQHPFYLIETLTSEVMKAEKSAYEKVIRMMAHEVNNNVAGIISTLEVLKGDRQNDADLQAIDACKERSLSMSRFITRFADVVKIPEPQLELCDLSEEVETCSQFFEGLCTARNIALRLNLTDEATPVRMDTTLFQQVLVNIVKNAAESIGSDGQIIVSVKGKTLTITDNGKGISPEAAQKILTPFFSTKPQGQGIGLILIRDILTKHGCTFSLQTSEEDGLTRFEITFP